MIYKDAIFVVRERIKKFRDMAQECKTVEYCKVYSLIADEIQATLDTLMENDV